MNTQQSQALTLSGHLCVTNYNDMNIQLNVIELAFNGTEKELWKAACVKFQELYALGLTPIFQFKDRNGIRQLQINVEDIDMIMSM
jgi:hypothetical protein